MGTDSVSTAQALITLTLEKFRAEMATLGPAAKDAARDMGTSLLKELKAIEKAAKATADAAAKSAKDAAEKASQAAKKTGKSWNDIAKNMQSNQAISDMEQLGAMFIMVGGGVSKMAMLFTSAVRPVAMLSEVLKANFGPQAPIVLGLAALPLLGVAVVGMFKSLSDGALEAAERLDKLGRAAEIPVEARRAMRDYQIATQELGVTMDKLAVSIGTAVMPEVTRLTTSTRLLIEYAKEGQAGGHNHNRLFGIFPLPDDPVLEGIADMSDRAHEFSDALWGVTKALSTGGASIAIEYLSEQVNNLVDSETRAATAAEASRLARERELDVIQAAAEAEEAYKKASGGRAAAAITKANTEEQAKAKKDVAKATRDAAEAEREHKKEVREMIAAVEFQTLQTLTYNKALVDQEVLYQQRKDARLEALKEEQAAAMAFEKSTLAMIERNNDQVAAYMERRAQVLRDVWFSVADQGLTAAGALTDGIVAGYERRAAEGEKLSAKEKTLAGLAYGLSQSFAATQAIMHAASMAIGMASQMAPYAGPAAPGIAAALSGTMLAAQLAAIAAAPPPEFPMGGMTSPDHHLVGVRGDEGILTARGLRNVGGEDGLDRLNGGERMGGGDGPETVRLLQRIANAVQPPRGPGVFRAMAGRRT